MRRGFGEVEPFAEDGVLHERRDLGEERGVVLVRGADENALPGFVLGREDEAVFAWNPVQPVVGLVANGLGAAFAA